MPSASRLLPLFLTLAPSLSAFESAADLLNSLSVPLDSPWQVTGAASLGLATGNADTLTYSLQVLGTYEQDAAEGQLGADLLYSENNGIATTNNFRFFGKYNHPLTDRFYLGTFGTFLTDDVADLNYRFDLGLTLGYHLIKNKTTKFSLELGPGYTWENQGGASDNYLSLRFAQRFEHKLNDRSKIWQSLTVSPEAKNFDNSLFTAEAGIDILLTEKWALRTSMRYQFDNTPATNRDEDDLLFLTGLSYALGGIPEPPKAGRKTLKPKAAKPKSIKLGWSTTGAFNFSHASGNADNLLLGVSLDSAYRHKSHETFFSAAYNFAQNAGDTSADSFRTSIQHNRILNERLFIGSTLSFFRDDIAEVDYRFTPSTSLGYYLIKEDNLTLSIEAGPGYTFENVGGITDEFFSLNAAQKLSWEINDRLTLNQNITATLDPSDGSDHILSAGVSLDTNITANLSWRIAANWTRDNTPARGRQKDDSTLTTGVSIRF